MSSCRVTIESGTKETSGANEITHAAVNLWSWSSMNVHSSGLSAFPMNSAMKERWKDAHVLSCFIFSSKFVSMNRSIGFFNNIAKFQTVV